MQSIQIRLGTMDLGDEEREGIRAALGRPETDRLPSAQECAEFIRQHGVNGVNAAMGAES